MVLYETVVYMQISVGKLNMVVRYHTENQFLESLYKNEPFSAHTYSIDIGQTKRRV